MATVICNASNESKPTPFGPNNGVSSEISSRLTFRTQFSTNNFFNSSADTCAIADVLLVYSASKSKAEHCSFSPQTGCNNRPPDRATIIAARTVFQDADAVNASPQYGSAGGDLKSWVRCSSCSISENQSCFAVLITSV